MTKVFGWLIAVAALFAFGMALIFTAAFSTHTTVFGGEADIDLQFISTQYDKAVTPKLFDQNHKPVAISADGVAHFKAKFETRDTNIFDTFNGGPHPRTAIVAFFEDETKHHEVLFRFDRHMKVWEAEVSFPDPTIADVQVENSSLKFEREENGQRIYSAEVFGKALVGPPIIKND